MNLQNYARMYSIFLLTTFWQNYKKWFLQIISHNLVHKISKKLHCWIYFCSNIIEFIFMTLTLIIFMLVPCSYLLRASDTTYLNKKGTLTYRHNHKNLTKLKKKKFPPTWNKHANSCMKSQVKISQYSKHMSMSLK